MKNAFLILLFLCLETYAFNPDSLYRSSISIGSYTTYFKDNHYKASASEAIFVKEPRRGIGLGYDCFRALSKRASVGLSAFVSHSICSYFYYGSFRSVSGKINFNILSLSPQFKYYVFRWMDIRIGVPVSYIVNDKFEHPEVAKAIGWYSADGKSNFRKPYLSYIIALDFNIYRRIGASISVINGFTAAGNMYKNSFGRNYVARQEMVSGYITLNYRIR